MSARTRPAEAYVHGVEGPVAVVPGRVAAWLERAAGLRRLRTEVRGMDPEVDATLVGLAAAAALWRERVGTGSPCGTGQAEQGTGGPASPVTTTEAATVLGITARGVRKAIEGGRLRAHRVGDVWLIGREDLAQYRAGRAA